MVKKGQRDAFRAKLLEIQTATDVKISFFGGLDFGRIRDPEQSDDRTLLVASLENLLAHKLKVILQGSAAKDYQDIAAMIRAGGSIASGLAGADKLFAPTFPPMESLRALTYFGDGDLDRLGVADRETIMAAAREVGHLPAIATMPGLF